MLFSGFCCVKSMKLCTQKVQQKHEIFVMFSFVLFTLSIKELTGNRFENFGLIIGVK
jgi:hypothetical protein